MKKIIATAIDIFISFFVCGYLIGLATGQTTENGFMLTGIPSLILIVEMILYFTLLKKKLGKTPGKIIMKVD
jgi:hypothetical protein